MISTQTFSILIRANNARTSTKGQSLYARVTVNGKRAEISLNRKADADRWDAANSRMRGNTMEAKSLNHYLQQVKAELYQVYNQMFARNEFITAETIKLRYTGKESPLKTILQTIHIHNEEMERKVGTDVVKVTWTKFLTLEKKLTVYIKKQRKKSDFYLEELDYRFVTEFEYYLRSVEKINANSTMKYIHMLKKVMNDAVRKDWLDKNPFQNFKCTFKWPEKEVLTMEELQRIVAKDFAIERLQQVKDYFIFGCFTGLVYVDVVNLEMAAIAKGIDGNLWLVTSRQKTKIPFRIPLLPEALSIIEKYKSHPKALAAETVFPKISNQKLNAYLKEIADLCGIQ